MRRQRAKRFVYGLLGWPHARNESGQAILEFAITLPIMVIFLVGIYDFSGAFNEKQKIAQAAQEGAILAGAQPTSDIQFSATAGAAPLSLLPVETSIINSLTASGVVTTSCLPVPGNGADLRWTYTISGCPGTLTIIINRGCACLKCGAPCASAGQPEFVATQVTVSYPYVWKFNGVIQLLFPLSNGYASPTLTETATVQNQM